MNSSTQLKALIRNMSKEKKYQCANTPKKLYVGKTFGENIRFKI